MKNKKKVLRALVSSLTSYKYYFYKKKDKDKVNVIKFDPIVRKRCLFKESSVS